MSRRLPTARHVSYALGYIGLGMLKHAAAELKLIAKTDQAQADVLSVRVELLMAAREWEGVIELAGPMARAHPQVESAWIGWAYALRELNRVAEARAVLLEAEPQHGATSAVLHYNLACYDSLLGDLPSARRRLATACKMDARLREDGAKDPDLLALREDRGSKRKRD